MSAQISRPAAVPDPSTTGMLPRPPGAFASPWVCSELGRSWGTQREVDRPQGWQGLPQYPGDAQRERSSSLTMTGLSQPTHGLPQDHAEESRAGGWRKPMVQKQDTPGLPSRAGITTGSFSDADPCRLQQRLTSPESRAFILPHLHNQRTKPALWAASRMISAFPPPPHHLGAGVLHKQNLDPCICP